VYVLDTRTSEAVVWLRRPSELDIRSFITPFRLVLNWLSGAFDGVVVHASAVVINGVGLLLSGGSGSGKSTTALAAALRGHAVVADDCVLVHQGRMHAIFARAKVDREWGLPGRPGNLAIQRVEGSELAKDFIQVRDLGANFLREGQLDAIAFPVLSRQHGFAHVSSQRTRALLSADSLRELHGGDRATSVRLAHLAIRYPGYRLLLGEDLDRRVATLQDLVHAVRSRRATVNTDLRSQ